MAVVYRGKAVDDDVAPAGLAGWAIGAPLDGLARAGWRFTYADKPSDFANTNTNASEGEDRTDDYAYSLGISVGREGRLTPKRVTTTAQ